jgi:hypothetical protein
MLIDVFVGLLEKIYNKRTVKKSGDKIKKKRWVEHVACMGERRGV